MRHNVLIVGGAGYIGSHMVKYALGRGARVLVFDNLTRGHRDAVPPGCLIEGDLLDEHSLKRAFETEEFDVIMHFAALAYVGESVTDPRAYYRNNVVGTLNLLDAMLDAGVHKLVFSSTCATYGVPDAVPIHESQLQVPINPYGRTKHAIEGALRDYGRAYGISSIALRYFNAAGCDRDGALGERHDPETHLIPLVLAEALRVKKGGDPQATGLEVFGNDFDTPDGTCIRDYVHVEDLASAHWAALNRLLEREVTGAVAYNLGNGLGFSVKDVIETCSRVTGVDIRYRIGPRRPGDPARLVGDADLARDALAWRPNVVTLEEIVLSSWRWMLSSAG